MENIALEIDKSFKAPLERVWKAWTEAEQLTQWFSPETMTTIVDQMEFKEGGHFRIIMRSSEGKDHIAMGMYKTIKPMNHLIFTWKWEGDSDAEETLVTLNLSEADGETRMNFKHERFPDEKTCDMHHQGWTSTFNKLTAQFQ